MGLLMMVYRIISLGIAGVSAAAMLYVGLICGPLDMPDLQGWL